MNVLFLFQILGLLNISVIRIDNRSAIALIALREKY